MTSAELVEALRRDRTVVAENAAAKLEETGFAPDAVTEAEELLAGLLAAPRAARPPQREVDVTAAVALPERGFIRDYVECYEPTTEAPREYHVGVALALISTAIGRQAYIQLAGRLWLNLYLLILGPSTQTRKSTAMRYGEATLRRAAKLHPGLLDAAWILPSGTVSSEALVEQLHRLERAWMRVDEFGRLLASARYKTYAGDLKELLTEVHGGYSPGRLTRADPIPAGPCYLTQIAATTRSRFEDQLTASDIASGFLGRYLIVYAQGTDTVLPFPPAPDPEREDSVANRLARIAEKVKGEVTFAPEARAAISEWYETRRAELAAGEDAELALPIFFRIDGTVRKLAALMEASIRPGEDLVVREAQARDAMAYADYVLGQIRERLLDGVLGDTGRKIRRLLEAIGANPEIRKSALMKATNIREPEFTALTTMLDDEDRIKVRTGLGRNGRGIAYAPAETAA